jgi:5-methylcytosine-specific restriction endonuclease McrA
MRTLVLNAGYEPLAVVSFRRAIVLVLAGKATVVVDGPSPVVSGSLTLPRPSVILLARYVRVPHGRAVPVSRRGVLRRDEHRCAYCGGHAATVDHVLPRSRGGRHVWENVVSACRRCNHVKGDRVISELGWRLRQLPRQPSGTAWRIIGTGRSDPRWVPYLVGHGHGLDFGSGLTATRGPGDVENVSA